LSDSPTFCSSDSSSKSKKSNYIMSVAEGHVQHNYLTRGEAGNAAGDDTISDDEDADYDEYETPPNTRSDVLKSGIVVKPGDQIEVELAETSDVSTSAGLGWIKGVSRPFGGV
jgi:hypothetical protein